MLRFDTEQMTQLEDEVFHRFVERVAAHIQEYAPELCGHRPREVLYRTARAACDHGRARGVEEERGLMLFASLSVMLGAGFDTDPCLPWVDAVLSDPAYMTPDESMQDLWEMAMSYLDDICEVEEAVVSHNALANWRDWHEAGAEAPAGLVGHLEQLWPGKAEAVGSDAMQALARSAEDDAQAYGFSTGDEIRRYAVLAWYLGHRFEQDPLHDWAGATLRDETIWDRPGQAIGQLHRGFLETVVLPAVSGPDKRTDSVREASHG